ncbi:hypothetical protein ABL78_3266 [Leptomonas seymouri]|uniref:Uncharacterized protein n=1 Tax=Leptomonas seymouri TaxID=5684 RepID=A0A0N1IL45_LEPSE|nr:hypothetical protein ABL78_3266 [Leptomonas seymouri]|eukprot:KPI87668.1 hypothetical protein ABL78_3266 [Leptomonas seymouri]
MSQGRLRQSHWREVLEELNAQQTLIESILHPGRRGSDGQTSLSFTTPSSTPQRYTDLTASPRTRSSSRVQPGGSYALLSPSFEASDGEERPTRFHSGCRTDANGGAKTDKADGHRGGSAAANGSKVVEALVEALSTSSWSSDSSTALPTASGESFPMSYSLPTVVAPPEPIVSHSPSPDYEGRLANMFTSRSTALQAAPLYLQATQIVAREFEERQQIMFNEFSTVTELISLFVCRMSQTSVSR